MLLFKVSDYIGGLSTVALVVLTAIIGVQILKQQGLSTLMRFQQRLSSGELPAQEVVEALFLAVGGAFLLTPGFITDTLGFICLIAPSRRYIVSKIISSGLGMAFFQGNWRGQRPHSSSHPTSHGVYEGKFTRELQPSNSLENRQNKPDER